MNQPVGPSVSQNWTECQFTAKSEKWK